MTGIEPRPQRWEARVLPLCHRGPFVYFVRQARARETFEPYTRVLSHVNSALIVQKCSELKCRWSVYVDTTMP